MTSLSQRMIGAAKLDVHIYEEVEADSNATGQALMVVVLSSIALSIGTFNLGGPGLLAGTVYCGELALLSQQRYYSAKPRTADRRMISLREARHLLWFDSIYTLL